MNIYATYKLLLNVWHWSKIAPYTESDAREEAVNCAILRLEGPEVIVYHISIQANERCDDESHSFANITNVNYSPKLPDRSGDVAVVAPHTAGILRRFPVKPNQKIRKSTPMSIHMHMTTGIRRSSKLIRIIIINTHCIAKFRANSHPIS